MKLSAKTAVVHCAGGCLIIENERACREGCTGCGRCAEECRLHAIAVDPDTGAARVDRDRCVGCGKCAAVCPQGLIEIVPRGSVIMPLCSTKNKGAKAKEACGNSCISCGLCVKKCPCGAISLEDGVPVIDTVSCIACGMCAANCPRGVIRDANGIFTERY